MRPLVNTLLLGAAVYYVATKMPSYCLPLIWALLGALYAGVRSLALPTSPATWRARADVCATS